MKVNYNISLNDSLYLLIVNTKIENIPKVEYEVFYPFSSNNFSTLNLSFCKDMRIDISFPVDISINDLDKYNKSSGLYNDICYTLKTESDTDITLKDRQNEYVENSMSICEEDCEFSEYDENTKRAICSCDTKLEMSLISKIKVDKKKLISNFKDIRNIGNFKMLKCYYLLFDINNAFKNLANYILIILLILSMSSIVIYIFHNHPKIKEYIGQLTKKHNINKEIDIIGKNNIKEKSKPKKDNDEKIKEIKKRKSKNKNNRESKRESKRKKSKRNHNRNNLQR